MSIFPLSSYSFPCPLQKSPLRLARPRIDLPKPRAAEIRVPIVSEFCAVREFSQFFHVAAPKHNVIRDQSFLELDDCKHYVAFPFFFAEFAEPRFSQEIFDDPVVPIWQ